MKNFNKGFTLIELLIVIALLGALAVGLLAALDPFEQLKKGTDTGIRNTVIELQGAVTRFYALKGRMPWCDPTKNNPVVADCPDPTTTGTVAPTQVDLSTTVNTGFDSATYFTALTQIINAGELKSGFATLANAQLTKIFVTGVSGLAANTSPSIAVCYKPTSKAFQADPNTKYCANGIVQGAAGCAQAANTCKSTLATGVDCYWCIQ